MASATRAREERDTRDAIRQVQDFEASTASSQQSTTTTHSTAPDALASDASPVGDLTEPLTPVDHQIAHSIEVGLEEVAKHLYDHLGARLDQTHQLLTSRLAAQDVVLHHLSSQLAAASCGVAPPVASGQPPATSVDHAG